MKKSELINCIGQTYGDLQLIDVCNDTNVVQVKCNRCNNIYSFNQRYFVSRINKYIKTEKDILCCKACMASVNAKKISESMKLAYSSDNSTTYSDDYITYRLMMLRHYIHDRCNCQTCTNYKFYGAKGISDRDLPWGEEFKTLCLSMGYRPGLTIDRVNPFGDYAIGNVRFITIQQQQKNKRSNCKSLYLPNLEDAAQ